MIRYHGSMLNLYRTRVEFMTMYYHETFPRGGLCSFVRRDIIRVQ